MILPGYDAMERAMAKVDAAFSVGRAPSPACCAAAVRHARRPACGSKPSRTTYASDRERNLNGLDRFVRGHIEIASTKADPAAWRERQADTLNRLIGRLGTDDAQVAGLNAFDLAHARDQLAAGVL